MIILKKYDMIIFDKDGTLVNTSRGIYAANRLTLEAMGYPIPEQKILEGIMGPPLEYCFGEICGVPHDEVPQAVHIYVESYKEKGRHMLDDYPGMIDTLKQLKSHGYRIGVATLKEEIFVKSILDESGLLPYIDTFYGSTHGDGSLSLSKSELIKKCLADFGVQPKRALMVGDSRYDGLGAMEAGVDFLGVSYGFSIKSEEDMDGIPNIGLAATPTEILNFAMSEI